MDETKLSPFEKMMKSHQDRIESDERIERDTLALLTDDLRKLEIDVTMHGGEFKVHDQPRYSSAGAITKIEIIPQARSASIKIYMASFSCNRLRTDTSSRCIVNQTKNPLREWLSHKGTWFERSMRHSASRFPLAC